MSGPADPSTLAELVPQAAAPAPPVGDAHTTQVTATLPSLRSVDAALRHLTVAERQDFGRAARKQAPRTGQGDWTPTPHRPDPVALLESQESVRIPELIPVRHGRMMASPFAFYRGAAIVMANDLATQPHSGLMTQLCGDAHIANFGGYLSPERQLLIDVNDFDETLPGPFEWDLKRLAASLVIAARHRGFTQPEQRAITLGALAEYREAMAALAEAGWLAIWYTRIDAASLLEAAAAANADRTVLKTARKRIAKAQGRTNTQAMERFTEVVDGKRRFIEDPPVTTSVTDAVEHAIRKVLSDYRTTLADDRAHLLSRYEFVDIARRAVGVGSVGTRCFVILLRGRDEGDPLVLQAKEAVASVLEPFCGPSEYPHAGQRVVEGQRLMQSASDIFLGWVDGPMGHHYYVRQLRDGKTSPDLETIRVPGLTGTAKIAGAALARAHARAGDPVAISAYMGTSDRFDQALLRFAEAYAAQNDRDYQAFTEAIASGRLTATPGI